MVNNIEQVKNSLKAMQKVFAGFEDYRVIGSTLVAAINHEVYRELHDIDLLIDERIYEEVSNRFKELGFRKLTKYAPGFKWDEFKQEEHLTFGILLRGKFNTDFFEYRPNKYIALVIKKDYLRPTNYELYGEKIRGIPLRSVYEGIKISSLNSKRKVDKQIILGKIGKSIPDGLSLDRAFDVQIFGIHIPHLYTIFSQIYNLIGGIRLTLGKSYDPWN